jgi:hypothetical protein
MGAGRGSYHLIRRDDAVEKLAMRIGSTMIKRTILVALAAAGLSGCVAYPAPGYYGAYPAYDGYYAAPAPYYYAPPVYGGVIIGGGGRRWR